MEKTAIEETFRTPWLVMWCPLNPEREAALVELTRANKAVRTAIMARDAIENPCTPEWYAAHKVARAACEVREYAQEAAYNCGALPRPYGWTNRYTAYPERTVEVRREER